MFAGREAARALAKMSLREEDCTDDLEGLTKREQETLRDWEERLLGKYSIVGQASACLCCRLLVSMHPAVGPNLKPSALSVWRPFAHTCACLAQPLRAMHNACVGVATQLPALS